MGGWVGSNIQRIEELYGPPVEVKEIERELKVYKYHHERIDPSCIQYWIVDSNGIIVSGHHEGRCRPIG